MRSHHILPAAAATAICSFSAGADANEPLYTKNLGPAAGLFGLPSQRNAATLAAGQFAAALHTSVANHYVSDSDENELLNFDGETLRIRDLGSKNGMSVNRELTAECALTHGDRFKIGSHEFQMIIEERVEEPETYVLPTDA